MVSSRTHTTMVKLKLRVIETARDEETINLAAKNGYFPLLKKVVPSEKIRSKFAILQNAKSGEIKVIGDARMWGDLDGYEMVIDFTFYYPHKSNSPFAAYLIPKDIAAGEMVFLADLIEDYVGRSWNQGDTYRLKGCEAIWNGKDFDIQYDPSVHRQDVLG